MRRPTIVSLLILCSLFVAGVLSAQTIRGYTLRQAIDTALTRDLRLDGLELQLEAARSGNAIIPLRRYPQLRYRAGIAYAPTTPSFGYDPALSNGGQVAAQITADQSLYDGGRRALESTQGKLQLEEIQQQQTLERSTLRAQVTQAFYEVLRDREVLALDSESLAETLAQESLVTRLFAGGAIGESDKLAAAGDVSRAELTYEQADGAYGLARYALAELIGFPGDTTITAIGEFDTLALAPARGLEQVDTSTNLELSIAKSELAKAELAIELSKVEQRPTLDLQGDAGVLSSLQNLELPPGQRSSILGASIGITLDGPLLDWGANDLLVEQRTREAENRRIENLLLTRELNASSLRLVAMIRSLNSNLQQAHTTVQLAEESYRRLLAVYAGGGTSLVTLMDAHRHVTDSRQTIVQILADMAQARAELERLHAH